MPTVLDFNRLKETLLPEWTKPENASVFDQAYRAPIRTIIKWLGLDDPQQVMAFGTPLEAGPMAGGALEAIGKRFPRFAEALKVYHGSPHDFEKFDASKIGTGEGAQAYGHGLYFAEKPDVALRYQEALSNPGEMLHVSSKYNESVIPLGNNPSAGVKPSQWRAARAVAESGGDLERAIERTTYAYPSPQEDEALGVLRKWKEHGASFRMIGANPGRMYEVAIHADPEHFLDWDKPLSQQSQYVRGRLQDLPEVQRLISQRSKLIKDYDPSGNDIYSALSGWRRGVDLSPPQSGGVSASQALKDIGLGGIKYHDAMSRSAGEGTRNYVVFPGNEHLIDILKKYGIAATTGIGVAGGLASQEGR